MGVVGSLLNMFFDIDLLVSWYLMGQVKFAISMAIPYILYYLSYAMVWFKQQKRNEKLLTWPFVLCMVYKEFKLLQFACTAWKDVKKARKDKDAFFKYYKSLILVKSLPIILIQSYVMLFWKTEEKEETLGTISDNTAFEEEFGPLYKILLSYISSSLSGSKGITDFLVYGQCTLLPKTGFFGEKATCRYICAWIANLCTLMSKIFTLGGIPVLSAMIPNQLMLSDEAINAFKWVGLGCALSHFIPLFILSLCSVKRAVGSWCNAIKVVLQCPAVIVLPIFSHFTIGSKDKFCGGCLTLCCKDSQGKKLAVSRTLTVWNIIICWHSYFWIMSIYFWFLGVTFYMLLWVALGLIWAGMHATISVFWLPSCGLMCFPLCYYHCCRLVEEEWDVEIENIV